MNELQKQNGITLIALVITIVVLIILAGVAINLTIGENGIFTRAKNARQQSDETTVKEKVETAVLQVQIDEAISEGTLSLKKLYENLESKDSNITLNEYSDGDTVLTGTYTINGKTYSIVINEKFKVEVGEETEAEVKPIQVGEIVWNEDGTVSIEASTNLTGNIEYQVNATAEDGWQTGPLPTNLQHGDKLYVRVNDGTTTTEPQEIEIKDTIKPEEFTISISKDTITYEKFKITSEGTEDKQTGIRDYSFIVTKDGTVEKEITGQDVTEKEIDKLSAETEYVVYMLAYDNAGNVRKSNEVIVTTLAMPVAKMFGQYVDYPVDIDGNTSDYDWKIFYIEDGTNNPNYKGATYIIPDYYVPASKMTTSLLNAGMIKYSSGTYTTYWSSVPSYKTILDGTDTTKPNVKNIFMYDYTDNATTRNYSSVKAVSRLLDITAWTNDFVPENLSTKGIMAIGGPTLKMWCASWNKAYPTQNVTASISGTGYQVNGTTALQLSSYTGYKTDAPNIYFPTKSKESDGTTSYWLASPSSYGSGELMASSYVGNVTFGYPNNCGDSWSKVGVRPLVYLPASVTLTPNATTDNLWNINYGE